MDTLYKAIYDSFYKTPFLAHTVLVRRHTVLITRIYGLITTVLAHGYNFKIRFKINTDDSYDTNKERL